MTSSMLSVHFIPFAIEDRGVSGTTAATVFGLMMGLNIIGVMGAGLLSDKIGGTKNWLALVYFVRGLAYVLLVTIDSVTRLWVFAIVAGFSWIATVPLTSSLTAEVYGLKAMGTISGISFMFHSIGGFLSILLAGFSLTSAARTLCHFPWLGRSCSLPPYLPSASKSASTRPATKRQLQRQPQLEISLP